MSKKRRIIVAVLMSVVVLFVTTNFIMAVGPKKCSGKITGTIKVRNVSKNKYYGAAAWLKDTCKNGVNVGDVYPQFHENPIGPGQSYTFAPNPNAEYGSFTYITIVIREYSHQRKSTFGPQTKHKISGGTLKQVGYTIDWGG